MTVDLSQFYSAGYFLIRRSHPGWEQLDRELLPAKLISLSGEITPHFVMKWGIFEGLQQDALDFGIPQEKLEAFLAWCHREGSEDFSKVFDSSEDARQFIRQFDLSTEDLHLIGVGIPHIFEEKLWNEPSAGISYGVEKIIEMHLLLEDCGQPLGFEIITYEYQDFAYSWLGTYAHRPIYTLYGIRPNAYGLIDRFEDAMKVYEWIEDKSEGPRGEPVPYDVALLVDYPLMLDR